MNYLILTAGIFALFASIGHFTIGTKEFLKPVMNSNVDIIPKKVMQSIFHYMSVFLVFSTVVLLSTSMGQNLIFENSSDIVKLIAVIYAGFALVQFFIAATSSINMGVFKLFQWIFWVLIAIFSFLGL